MDQKPPQSPENQNQQPQAGTPPTSPAQPASAPTAPSAPTTSSAPVPGNSAPNAGMTSPSGVPGQPHDVHPGKSKTMLFAVLTLGIVILGAVIVTFTASNSAKEEEQPQTVEKQQVVPPTEVPTVVPTEASLEEQIDAVNTTENDTDLQEADKDLQSL